MRAALALSTLRWHGLFPPRVHHYPPTPRLPPTPRIAQPDGSLPALKTRSATPTLFNPSTLDAALIPDLFSSATAPQCLRRPVRCQRHLPRSSTHLIENVFLHLARMLHDPTASPLQRQTALLLLLLAPRWLWLEPPLSARDTS